MKIIDVLPDNFQQVQTFLKSWGLYPSDEPTDEYNEEVIRQGINNPCFEKMKQDAERLFGVRFARFCSRQIDATDDSFYLTAETWPQVQEAWSEYSAGMERKLYIDQD